jgi:uncharacterized protein DUF1236
MKRALVAGVAALGLFASRAVAQIVVIAPEQRTEIKEYVVQHKVKPVQIRERIAVGVTIPADVELHAVPSDWGPSFSRYRYVYADDDVVLVEPSSRKVIQVIE